MRFLGCDLIWSDSDNYMNLSKELFLFIQKNNLFEKYSKMKREMEIKKFKNASKHLKKESLTEYS